MCLFTGFSEVSVLPRQCPAVQGNSRQGGEVRGKARMVFHAKGQGRLFSIPSNPDFHHLHQQQQHHYDHQHHRHSKEIERIIWWTGLTASWSADLTFVIANRLLMLHSLLFVTRDLRFYPSDDDRDDEEQIKIWWWWWWWWWPLRKMSSRRGNSSDWLLGERHWSRSHFGKIWAEDFADFL